MKNFLWTTLWMNVIVVAEVVKWIAAGVLAYQFPIIQEIVKRFVK